MRKILISILLVALMMGVTIATDSAVSSVNTLGSENAYATETYWGSAPTGSNTQYVAYNAGYRYFVAINATSVGTSPKLNILAGTSAAAWRSGIGNYALSLTANRTIWFGPIESARFLNATGYFRFSTTNVTTAKMMILKVVR